MAGRRRPVTDAPTTRVTGLREVALVAVLGVGDGRPGASGVGVRAGDTASAIGAARPSRPVLPGRPRPTRVALTVLGPPLVVPTGVGLAFPVGGVAFGDEGLAAGRLGHPVVARPADAPVRVTAPGALRRREAGPGAQVVAPLAVTPVDASGLAGPAAPPVGDAPGVPAGAIRALRVGVETRPAILRPILAPGVVAAGEEAAFGAAPVAGTVGAPTKAAGVAGLAPPAMVVITIGVAFLVRPPVAAPRPARVPFHATRARVVVLADRVGDTGVPVVTFGPTPRLHWAFWRIVVFEGCASCSPRKK